VSAQTATPAAAASTGRRFDPSVAIPSALAALLGLACGVSSFLNAYYDLAVFGWIGLGLLGGVLALVIGTAAPRGRAFLLALIGLVTLWAWALISSTWGESSSQALLVANRWLTYAAFLAVATFLLRERPAALALLCGVGAGGLALLVYLVIELMGGGAPELFLARRLFDPIGYVNALGTYLLIAAFWPAIALAERGRPVLVSALGAGAASLAASLMILTQSRGAAAAAAISVVVVLGVVPGRLRRAWLLLVVAGGVAISAPTMLDVYRSGSVAPTPASAHDAAVAALLTAVGVAFVWGGALLIVRRLSGRGTAMLRKVGVGALACLVAAGIIIVAAFLGRISHEVSRQYKAFIHPGQAVVAASNTTHLTSGAGNRYDLWRIAWTDFTEHPFKGVGAGNWSVSFFRARRVTQDLHQPHSVELQALSELGIVGGLALLVFVIGVYLGLLDRRPAIRGDPTTRAMTVAACGIFTGWLAHTSVDWMQLMPGLTGIALSGAAVLIGDEGRRGERRRLLTWPALIVVLAIIGVGAAFLVRQTLGDHYRIEAQAALGKTPRQAISDANQALAYDGDLLAAYYLKAAAYARLDDYTSSRATLLAAARREPHAWITWALLGDLAVRGGDLTAARAAYRRALALNPREPDLTKVAISPRRAVGPQP
jgi:hypothetical protein